MLTSNQFTKGINQDINPKFQEDGSYRFALNAVLETELGEQPAISNELGNILCVTLPEGKVLNGHALLDNNEVLLALYDPAGEHEIGILNSSSCEYTTLSVDSCWNFSDTHPVDMLFRIRNGCERIVYIRDNYNDYRVINLTDTSYWLDGTDVIDCNRLKLYKDYNVPCLSILAREGQLGVQDSGGQLQVGLYYPHIRYLDAELNPTQWIFGGRAVPIADEPFNYSSDTGTTNLYDGASNTIDSPYYKGPTNKSIKFQLSQLDNDTYAFYQLAMVKRTGDSGEISGIDVLYPVPINSASDIYTYTGFDSQVQGETTLDDLLSVFQPIDKVGAHAHDNGRLYLANISNNTYDWSTFQRYATAIKTEWVKDPSSSPVDTYVKQGTFYFTKASFMEDEIYALGIVYVMEDGTFSPVFHIPGRAPDVVTGTNPIIGAVSGVADDGEAWDTGTLTSYGTGLVSSKTKRWQQISTATKYSASANRGLMGYHETVTETYPDIEACDGEAYWGTDWQGNTIDASTKIRHHRMPGAELIASISPGNVNQVGLYFTNVTYPEGATRHFFVYGDRTYERSIIAKGALVPLLTSAEFGSFADYEGDSPLGGESYYREFYGGLDNDLLFAPQLLRPTSVSITSSPDNLKTFAFFCSETILKDKIFAPRYFRLEKFLTEPEYGFGLGANRDSDDVTISQYDDTFSVQTDLWYFRTQSFPTTKHNYTVSYHGKAPKATYGSRNGSYLYNQVDRSMQNLSFNLSPLIITLDTQIDDWVTAGSSPVDAIAYGSLKVDIDPFANLFTINYKRTGNCPSRATSTASAFSSYNGDTFVGRVNITDYSYAQTEEDGKVVEAYHMAFPTQDTLINYEFRHGAYDPVYSYFQWNYQYDPEGHKQFRQHLVSKYYEVVDGVMELYPQNAAYNDSYSYLQGLETYLPLPFNYEYCKDCIETYPYRIYYSNADSSEDQSDNYRIFRPNNYKDLPGETGYITDLFINFNQLYVRTINSIFHLPTQPQQLQSDGSTIYLGTGEVLSLPAQQLKTSENAFGGGNFFKARTTTEYGTVYVDDVSGRVFLLTNQLNDISNLGLRNFFQNNGRVFFLDQFFDTTGEAFPFLSTSSPSGVGYISWYDPRYKRVFIHKRDFKLLQRYNLTYVATETDDVPGVLDTFEVRFNGFSFYANNASGDPTQITFEDAIYFENKSFTLSYSFLTNHWVSFHSYLPKYAFGGHRDFYSFNTDLYRHNVGEFTTYYDSKHPHIIDLIAVNNPLQSTLTSSILYSSTTSYYDPQTEQYHRIPETYTGFIAYNSNQSTGYNSLTLKTDAFMSDSSNAEALVRHTDRQYRLNDLRDRTLYTDNPIWDSAWTSIQSNYFIDKVPFSNNIDINQSAFNAKRLRDHYLGIRFFFQPELNAKITTDIIATTYANRNR